MTIRAHAITNGAPILLAAVGNHLVVEREPTTTHITKTLRPSLRLD